MDKFDHYKQQLDKDLADDSKPWTKYLKLAEEKTGVNRTYIFLGEEKIRNPLQFFISSEAIIVCFSPATTTANNLVCNFGWKSAQGYQESSFYCKSLYNQPLILLHLCS